MLDGLRQFIADVISPNGHEHRAFDDTGYRLAATALLLPVLASLPQPLALLEVGTAAGLGLTSTGSSASPTCTKSTTFVSIRQ